MIPIKKAYLECRAINRKTVSGENVVYYRDNSDTACTTTIGDTDYHLFDGTSTFMEGLKNLIATGGKKRHHAFFSYSETAEDIFESEEFQNRVDYTKRNVFFGISRGGGETGTFTVKFYEKCKELGITPNTLTVPIVSPPAGGKRFKKYCKSLGFECLRIDMAGGKIPKWPWYGKHYNTGHLVLKNTEKGWLNKHLNVYKYLPDREI